MTPKEFGQYSPKFQQFTSAKTTISQFLKRIFILSDSDGWDDKLLFLQNCSVKHDFSQSLGEDFEHGLVQVLSFLTLFLGNIHESSSRNT